MEEIDIVTREIIKLQQKLSFQDWKALRNDVFPEYYQVRLKKGGNTLDWKYTKLEYIERYIKQTKWQ